LFDGGQLARWSIDESRLPPGSEVRFRAPSLWRDHRDTVIATVGVITTQAALIAALILQVRRRRAAERQAHNLSGRVLTAQEEERRRIARELHDGANQEVALFAMQLDQSGMGALADRARTLSRDLHRLSHELHPEILDQVGLVSALREFASRLAAHQRLHIEVREARWPTAVPRPVAITLYRVAQEALQNAVKHSGAPEATVDLEGTPAGLSMTIADRGVGFDPTSRPEAQLGLAGMQERLRSIGGQLDGASIPGRGTRILATVSAEAISAMEMDERLTPPGAR
jgi:signal transduction histidine kinase